MGRIMKRNQSLVTVLLLSVFCPMGQLAAQPTSKQGKGREPRPTSTPAGISGAESARLAAARKKSLEDPSIRELMDRKIRASRDLATAMRAYMIKVDPSLKQVLDKMARARAKADSVSDRFAGLSAADRQKIKTARTAAESDPKVAAARRALASASSEEEKQSARRELSSAIKKAMIAHDPSVSSALSKISPQGKSRVKPAAPGKTPASP